MNPCININICDKQKVDCDCIQLIHQYAYSTTSNFGTELFQQQTSEKWFKNIKIKRLCRKICDRQNILRSSNN